MDGNNWRPAAQGESNGMDGGDWRALLSPDARQKIVNKIMETLKKHLPISGPEGLVELQKIAVRFEEKIYTAATSQSDYLRKISMKMLTMESKSQPAGATNSLTSNSAGGNQNPSDPALHGMQSQVHSPGQPLSMPLANQSQLQQLLLPQNLPTTTTQSSVSLSPALSSVTGITRNAISNIVSQGSNLQNISGISQNSLSNSMGQGVQSNIFTISQRQMQGRPQQVVSLQLQQQLIYQQQLLKQKMQRGNIQSNLLPSHMQQQQPLLEPNQMQLSQLPLMQISSSGLTSSQPTQQTQPSLMQSTQPGLQQNQQSGPSVLQQQSVLRQQQQTPVTQQSILPSQQQQQLTGQQPSSGNMQNQLLGQQNSISDISQQQQLRLLGQQNNLSNMQQLNSLQREMQQRMQTPGSLLPPQNAIEQQKQTFQSQRGLPEAPSSSMDSTAQTGHTGVVDWQEEIYQKIKSMKELYFPELNEMYQKINLKFQQHDALLQQPKQQEQFERLRYFKKLLECMITFLQLPKSNIPIGFKDKLPQYEKQIIGILSSHRLKKPGMPQQQGQQQPLRQPGGQSHSMTPQLQSHIPQLQQHDNHVNQMQPMNLQPSMTSLQPGAVTGLQHGSMPLCTHLGVPTAEQSMINALQLSSNLDSTSGNAMSGMVGYLQQNTVNAAQQANINTLSQSGPSALQPNMNLLQKNSNMIQHQHRKKEQLMQTLQLKQQQWKQQMHQQLMQQQQLKMGAPFPISSPQNFQAQSPQFFQHSSPQIDQQTLLASIPKSATPIQSANSPFIIPPPSTPFTPSPLQGDPEKQQSSGISSNLNAGNMGHQQTAIDLIQAQSLAIGTPGISTSPLLAEFSSPDGNQGSAPMALSGKSSTTERPLEGLFKVDGMAPYYVIYRGRVPEFYASWPLCQDQVHQFGGYSFHGFSSLDEAIEAWCDFTGKRSPLTVEPPTQHHPQAVLSTNNSDRNTNQPFFCAETYLVPQEISTAPFGGLDFPAVNVLEQTVGTVSHRRPYNRNASLMFLVLLGVALLLVSIYMIVDS